MREDPVPPTLWREPAPLSRLVLASHGEGRTSGPPDIPHPPTLILRGPTFSQSTPCFCAPPLSQCGGNCPPFPYPTPTSVLPGVCPLCSPHPLPFPPPPSSLAPPQAPPLCTPASFAPGPGLSPAPLHPSRRGVWGGGAPQARPRPPCAPFPERALWCPPPRPPAPRLPAFPSSW